MKIRFYLRGLGLGILVTSIFFLICGRSSQTMSDEMIKARAKELGMTESVVLAELATQEKEQVLETEEAVKEVTETEESAEESAEEKVEEPVEEPVTETVDESEEESVSKETDEEDVSISEETTVEEVSVEESVTVESTSANTEPVSVMVNRGEGSDTVSKRLQEAGLVAEAYEYDRYLMANGYDKRIGAGEHIIPAGATWEDIAKILCNMK